MFSSSLNENGVRQIYKFFRLFSEGFEPTCEERIGLYDDHPFR